MEVPEPVLVSNTAEVVAGEVTIVVERVELVKVVAMVVGRDGGSACRGRGA